MMSAHELVELAWTQAWQLTLLIAVVWATVRWVAKNRPHLAHALWLVVLLKCVTPPVWSSPAGIFSLLQWQAPTVEVNRPQPSAPTISENADGEVTVAAGAVPASAARTTDDVPARTDHQPHVESATSFPDASARFDHWSLLLAMWLGGAVLFFATAVGRFGLFALRLSRLPAGDSAEVTACVRRLSQRLAVRRHVRVIVTQSRVGPAVIGWLRPTILLPSVIIEGKSSAELEPLVAHELIHVRRGDLFWATLQAVATSLWWFHPLVWIASRMLTREAERSCDEEVVAGLGCEPAVYARGLIDVLERKHRLHSAPSLPGVRAVDITSSRLERIMQLGQGSHRRTPWWCWALLGIAATVALPGAALTLAEENEPVAAVTDDPPAPPLPATPDVLASPLVGRFDVDDLLQRLTAERGLEGEEATTALASFLAPATLDDLTSEAAKQSIQLTVHSEGKVRKLTLSGSGSGVRIVDGTLYTFDSHERRRQVRDTIERLRKYGFERLTISARFVSAPPDEIEKLWSELKSTAGRSADHRLTDAASPLFYLRDAQLSRFLKTAQANSRINILQSPRITVLNGQQATSNAMKKRPFVTGFKQRRDESGELTDVFEPIVRVVEEGTQLGLQAVLGEDQRVQLECALTLSEIRNVETVEIPQGTQDGSVSIQVPEVASRSFSSMLDVSLGETVVISGLRQQTVGDTEMAMLVLITCEKADTDLALSAITPLSGASDRIRFSGGPVEGRMANSAPAVRAAYSRIAIQGPRIEIGAAGSTDPPHDKELIDALLRHGQLEATERQAVEKKVGSMRIAKEKIADYLDPIRRGPDGEWLRPHHAHYKCTFYRQADAHREPREGDVLQAIRPSDTAKPHVLYIDHVHDYLISVEAPAS